MINNLFSSHIIQSILDFDVYKLNMMNAVAVLYPNTQVSYKLIVRSSENILPLLPEIKNQVNLLENLSFNRQDISYIKSVAPNLTESFLRSLSLFRFAPQKDVSFYEELKEDGTKQLGISITGVWKQIILYETFIMSIICEVRSRTLWSNISPQQFELALKEKVSYLKHELKKRSIDKFHFIDMATRRRFSAATHQQVLQYMQQKLPDNLIGTSNYHFAKKFNLKPIGTVAHEWFMAHQGLVDLANFQKLALQNWLEVFNSQLGIALTDTINIDAFLQDFDLTLSRAYSGVRHDSGCPYQFGDKMIAHYKSLEIDPLTKNLIFTDGLNFSKALDICEYFQNKIMVTFGIGTWLVNDINHQQNMRKIDYEPLSIVIKMNSCNFKPVAKISDEPNKIMCDDPELLEQLQKIFIYGENK